MTFDADFICIIFFFVLSTENGWLAFLGAHKRDSGEEKESKEKKRKT